MNQPLFRILYCSRNLIGGGEPQQRETLGQILQTARKKNAKQEVTGALLYNSDYFAQVLEGPRTAIEAIFERIQRDDRHGDVTVLECVKSERRDFEAWSMAHAMPINDAEAQLAGSTLCRAMSAPTTAGEDLLEMLRSLVNQEQ